MKMKKVVAKAISTGLGLGYAPLGPGTMGALAITIVYWFIPLDNLWYFIFLVLGITLIGVYSSSITEKEMQSNVGDQNFHDPGIIIIDEIAGMLVTLIAIPKEFKYLVIAFILFRFFDIVKPFPIKKVEKLKAGWGIMMDDVVSGIFANVLLRVIILIFNF